MSRFRIRMRVQGLEVEVDGTRDDAPAIAHNLSRQFAGLLEPAAHIVEGDLEGADNGRTTALATAEPTVRTRSARKGRTVPARPSGDRTADVTWKHDPAKWGSPQQVWSAADKALWLLYVSGQEAQVNDMSSTKLASTFNRMFRQAGMIRAGNLPRDLGRLKTQAPALVGEDATKTPTTWFLTIEGTKKAEELIKQARGQTPGSS